MDFLRSVIFKSGAREQIVVRNFGDFQRVGAERWKCDDSCLDEIYCLIDLGDDCVTTN